MLHWVQKGLAEELKAMDIPARYVGDARKANIMDAVRLGYYAGYNA